MGKLRYDDAYSVQATGTQVTAGGASARVAIPNDASGRRARFIRLQVTSNAYVRAGDSTVVATVNDVLLSPNFDVVLDVMPNTHIAYLQEAPGAKINISPLET